MKIKIFSILTLSLLVMVGQLASSATIPDHLKKTGVVNGHVKSYLGAYYNYLNHIHSGSLNNRIKVGNSGEVQGNLSMLHMLEVIQLIQSGQLDDCCWRGTPNTYGSFVNANTAQTINASTVINPAYPEGDSNRNFKIPHNYGLGLYDVIVNFIHLTNSDSAKPNAQGEYGDAGTVAESFDTSDELSIALMRNILGGLGSSDITTSNGAVVLNHESMLGNLIWSFSYLSPGYYNNSDPTLNLKPDFTHNYAWACIVCEGAGFYDTSLLHTINPVTNVSYYDEIVTATNFPRTYAWLQSFSTDAQAKPDLQVSIGLTFQGQSHVTEGTIAEAPTYPVHNHQSEELYIVLDSVGLASKFSDRSDFYNLNYDIGEDFGSYFASATNSSHLSPVFGKDMGPQMTGTHRTFQKVENGDVVFNKSWSYHAMHPGKYYQFGQWARLTHPEEGTFYPFNGHPGVNPGMLDQNPESQGIVQAYLYAEAEKHVCDGSNAYPCSYVYNGPAVPYTAGSTLITSILETKQWLRNEVNRLISENNTRSKTDPLGCSESYTGAGLLDSLGYNYLTDAFLFRTNERVADVCKSNPPGGGFAPRGGFFGGFNSPSASGTRDCMVSIAINACYKSFVGG